MIIIERRKSYKPKIIGQGDINTGMRKLQDDMKSSFDSPSRIRRNRNTFQSRNVRQESDSSRMNIPNYWGTPPSFQEKPVDNSEEDAYWSAQDWEEWAYGILQLGEQKMTPKDMLPEWFIEAVEQEG